MYKSNSRALAVLLCITLFVSTWGTTEKANAANTVNLAGWLTVLWGDSKDDQSHNSTPIYQLRGETGGSVNLEMDISASELIHLQGQKVVVRGNWGTSKAGFPVFLVQQVSPLSLSAASQSPTISGPQPWVSILCKFKDVVAEPKDLIYFQNMFANAYPGLDHYWREQSYDLVNVVGSGAYGWFTLPQPRSYYVYDQNGDGQPDLDHTRALNDCTAVADSSVYFPHYVGINMMFNDLLDCCAWGGYSYLTLDKQFRMWRLTWEPPWGYGNISVIDHEMGHGFGLPHSSGMYGQTYDNDWDVMSNAWICPTLHPIYGCMGQHTISYHKDILNWIATDQRFTVAENTRVTLTLERLAQPETNDFKIARVPIAGSSQNFYTVEARIQEAYDLNLPGEGVIIHEVLTTRSNEAQVVDIDGDGDTGDEGAIWSVGETFIDSANQITITVNAATDTGYVVTIQSGVLPVFTSCSNQTQIPESECQALVDLYNQTDGPNWSNNRDWLALGYPCDWTGVQCQNGHVTQINLNANFLNGTIPTALGNLGYLQSLDFSRNVLTGTLPAMLGGLLQLSSLYLQENQLGGEIPVEFTSLTSLTSLDLGYNKFSASGTALLNFLKSKDNDWDQSQTVPPTNLGAENQENGILLIWSPIPYTADGGYYQILYSTSPGGPYIELGTTNDKTASSYLALSLDSSANYYFVIRTFTPAHGTQQNDLWSIYTSEVQNITLDKVIFLPLTIKTE